MKAIAVDYFGAPPSLHDLPVPVRARARCWSGSGPAQ
jgi:hypothetical protein